MVNCKWLIGVEMVIFNYRLTINHFPLLSNLDFLAFCFYLLFLSFSGLNNL